MFGISTVSTTIIAIINVYLVKLLVDEITTGRRPIVLIGIIFTAAVTILICTLLLTDVESKRWYRVVMIRLKFLLQRGEKLMTMDFETTENPAILDKFEKSKEAVREHISATGAGIEVILNTLFIQVAALFSIISYLVVLVTFSPTATLLIIGSIMIEYYVNLKLAKYEHTLYDKLSPLRRKLQYYEQKMCDDKFSKDIRLYKISTFLLKKYDFFGTQQLGHLKAFANKTFTVNIISVLINVLRYGLLNWYLFYCVINNGLSIGDFSLYITTATAFSLAITTMMVDFARLIKQNLFINDYMEFMDIPSKNSGADLPVNVNNYDIEFKDVTFCYPNSDYKVLENFSLKIKAGQKLALVGLNGCGKTTLIKLLTGLYTQASGEILLGGTPIRDYNKVDYYGLFSVVFQDINIFAWTIAENIALCEYENIDIERLENSLKLAGLWDRVNELTDSYRTNMLKILDSQGVELSGGQAQKLALARALYKTSPLIILDEPTAALDPIAEYNIYQGFDTLIGDKTAIYVSHRLSSTRFCDCIAYLDNGKIVEYGTHEQLMELGGKYADMFSKQAYYYQENPELAV